MDFNSLLEQIKQHPAYEKVGMILCHQGVVRATDRDGKPVRSLRVSVDYDKLDRLIAAQKERDGIIEILVQINADRDLRVGEDVMGLVVAGDIRENVIAVLTDTLNSIKSDVTRKKQDYA